MQGDVDHIDLAHDEVTDPLAEAEDEILQEEDGTRQTDDQYVGEVVGEEGIPVQEATLPRQTDHLFGVVVAT